MNLIEINDYAERQYAYLQKHIERPLDAISVIGLTLLRIFDRSTDGTMTIERFAEDFRRSLIESYKARSRAGPGTVQ